MTVRCAAATTVPLCRSPRAHVPACSCCLAALVCTQRAEAAMPTQTPAKRFPTFRVQCNRRWAAAHHWTPEPNCCQTPRHRGVPNFPPPMSCSADVVDNSLQDGTQRGRAALSAKQCRVGSCALRVCSRRLNCTNRGSQPAHAPLPALAHGQAAAAAHARLAVLSRAVRGPRIRRQRG